MIQNTFTEILGISLGLGFQNMFKSGEQNAKSGWDYWWHGTFGDC